LKNISLFYCNKIRERFTAYNNTAFTAKVSDLLLIALLLAIFAGHPPASGEEKSEEARLTRQETAWIESHPVIRLAPDPAFHPIEYFDENGNYTGIAADYARMLEQKLGIRFVIIRCENWDEVIFRAKRFEVDVLNAVVKTPQREKFLHFCSPYLTIPSVIIVRKHDKRRLTIDMMKGMKIVMVSGYGYVELIRNKYPLMAIEQVSDLKTGLQIVSFGLADAFIGDLATASYYIEAEGITNLRLAGEIDPPNISGFAVRSDWPELGRILDKGIMMLTEDERKNIYTKWIHLDSAPALTIEELRNYVLIPVGIFALLLLSFLLWNRTLRKMVNLRTNELQNELNERKRVEHILARNESHLRTLVQTIPDLIWLKDRDGVYISCNKMFERFFGASENEIRGKTDYDFLERELADFFIGQDQKAMEAGKPVINEESITFADDGHIAFLETIKTPMYNDSGTLIGVLGIGRDITGRKLAEDKIKSLLEEKELLLREVHHRIKNNMNTIKGLLTLQISAENNPSAAASLRDAESRVQSMILLYDRLYCTENYRELSIKYYLQSLVEYIVGSFTYSGIIKIVTEIDDFILNIQVLTPLGIIVNEILTNIMKYAFAGRESGVITISARINNNHAVIAIKDNGIGIPESVNFDTSSGFGLSLVSMLVEQMEGSIRIERNNGTGFIIDFDV